MANYFSEAEIQPSLLEPGLRSAFSDPDLRVRSIASLPFNGGMGVLTQLAAERLRKWIGVYRFEATLAPSRPDVPTTLRIFVKSKALDDEMMVVWNWMARRYGPRIEQAWRRNQVAGPWYGSHIRELAIYGLDAPALRAYSPRPYVLHRDDAREAYVLAVEEPADALPATLATAEGWSQLHLRAAIDGLANIHSAFLGKAEELRRQEWLGHVMDTHEAVAARELWDAYQLRMAELPQLPAEVKAFQRQSVDTLESWFPEFDRLPRTLTHGDFTPRNMVLRGDPKKPKLCAFDWEVSMCLPPQSDLVEFLTFTLGSQATRAQVRELVELHRQRLSEISGVSLDPEQWQRGFDLAMREFVIRRLPRYVLGVTIFPPSVGVPNVGAFFSHLLSLR